MNRSQNSLALTYKDAAALVGVARQTDYSASKFAAFGFDESLRAELRAAHTPVNTLVVCPYYIDTGMFDGVQTLWPRLLPILHEEQVASRVLDAVEAGSRKLFLPPVVNLLPVLRILPVGALSVAPHQRAGENTERAVAQFVDP